MKKYTLLLLLFIALGVHTPNVFAETWFFETSGERISKVENGNPFAETFAVEESFNGTNAACEAKSTALQQQYFDEFQKIVQEKPPYKVGQPFRNFWIVTKCYTPSKNDPSRTLVPVITSFSPEEATIGTEVSIIGDNFTDDASVKLAGTPIQTQFVSKTKLSITLPRTALSSGQLEVTQKGGSAKSTGTLKFNYPTDTKWWYIVTHRNVYQGPFNTIEECNAARTAVINDVAVRVDPKNVAPCFPGTVSDVDQMQKDLYNKVFGQGQEQGTWFFNSVVTSTPLPEKGAATKGDCEASRSAHITEVKKQPVYANVTDIAGDCYQGGSNPYNLLAPFPGIGRIDETVTFSDYVNRILRIAIGIAIVFAIVIIVMAGVEMAVSESISGKNKAKEQINNVLWSLGAILLSYLILNTINPRLVNNTVGIPTANIELESIGGDTDYALDTSSSSSLPTAVYCPGSGGSAAVNQIAKSFIGNATYQTGKIGVGKGQITTDGKVSLDCSGFATKVLACAGYVPGTDFVNSGTYYIFSDSRSQDVQTISNINGETFVNGVPLKPGDMLGWKAGESKYYKEGHVIIYIGGGIFADSSGSPKVSGKAVKTFSLVTDSPYNVKYVGSIKHVVRMAK